MAFQFKSNDPRGEPPIQFVGDEFVVMAAYFHSSKKVTRARDYAEKLNRRARSAQPRTQPVHEDEL